MILVTLACFLLGESPDDEMRRLREIRKSIREKGAEATALLRTAHEDLDRAAYDAAVENHRKAVLLRAEREALLESETGLVGKVARELIPALDSETVETRDRASKLLVALGPAAIPVLERLLPGPSAEVQYRLTDGIARLKRMEIDAEGRLHQWASSARASSEYTNEAWSAMQATGKPDTTTPGDARTAWASLTADGGEEWLELGYENLVVPTRVRIHETYCPGAVVRVESRDDSGSWRVLWEGKDPVREAGGWFEVPVQAAGAIRGIRITFDSANVPGWNEIDAVELVGDSGP